MTDDSREKLVERLLEVATFYEPHNVLFREIADELRLPTTAEREELASELRKLAATGSTSAWTNAHDVVERVIAIVRLLAAVEPSDYHERHQVAEMEAATADAREMLTWPETMSPDLEEVLGRPNFTCAHLAEALRRGGTEIARKAEAEQAAVIFWLVRFVLRDGSGWRERAEAALKAMRDKEKALP